MKTNKMIGLGFCLASLWFLFGCESPGHALAKSAVDKIRDGQTTRAEVDKAFGEPMQMTRSPVGRTLYLYQRFYGPDIGGYGSTPDPRRDESNLMMLSVLFDPSGVVEKHLYSHTQPEFNRFAGRAGRQLSSEDLNKIVPQKTTRAELTSWFGPHWSEELTLSGQRLVVWIHADAVHFGRRLEVQALEVILDDAGTAVDFRVTRRDPWRN